jgi:hypothetical protein
MQSRRTRNEAATSTSERENEGHIRDNYHGNYDRRASIEKHCDASNLFHIDQNIKPASMTPEV